MRSGWLGLLAAVVPFGCGARSTLDAAPGATPAAGTSTGTGGHATADAGAAGGSLCSGGLIVTGPETTTPVLTAPGPLPGEARMPRFARLFADQPDLALVFGLPTFDAAGYALGDTSFTPWGSWPPPTAMPTLISNHRSGSFAVASGDGGTYSMLFDLEDLAGCATCQTGTAFDAAAHPATMLDTSMILDPTPKRASLVQQVDQGHLVGFMPNPASGATSLSLRMIESTGITLSADGVACGSKPLVADAVVVQGRALVATSTSLAKGSCAGAADDPMAVEVLDATTGSGTWPSVIGYANGLGTGTVKQLALAPRSDGAWLVVQMAGQAKTSGALQVVRLDAHGAQVAMPFAAVGPGRSDFAAAPLGDGFALAWFESNDPHAPSLGFAFFDASGTKLGTTIVTPLPMATPVAPLTLASRSGSLEVVLGWGATLSNIAKNPGAGIHLLRVGCR